MAGSKNGRTKGSPCDNTWVLMKTTTLMKLMVLMILGNADYPLSTATLYEFFLETGYAGYFDLNKTIYTLIEDGYVESAKCYGSTFMTITDKGRDTITNLKDHVSRGIREDIKAFLEKNGLDVVNKASVVTDYYKTGSGDYVAELTAREKYSDLISIKINVSSEESAKTMCDNWSRGSSELYAYIIRTLLVTSEKGSGDT